MNTQLIFNCTRGREDPGRAKLPFVAANIAGDRGPGGDCAVHRRGRTPRHEGRDGWGRSRWFPKLCDLLNQFVANSGKVWLCGACTKPRGITEEQLAEGVTIVGAAKVVEEAVAGAKTVAFA